MPCSISSRQRLPHSVVAAREVPWLSSSPPFFACLLSSVSPRPSLFGSSSPPMQPPAACIVLCTPYALAFSTCAVGPSKHNPCPAGLASFALLASSLGLFPRLPWLPASRAPTSAPHLCLRCSVERSAFGLHERGPVEELILMDSCQGPHERDRPKKACLQLYHTRRKKCALGYSLHGNVQKQQSLSRPKKTQWSVGVPERCTTLLAWARYYGFRRQRMLSSGRDSYWLNSYFAILDRHGQVALCSRTWLDPVY